MKTHILATKKVLDCSWQPKFMSCLREGEYLSILVLHSSTGDFADLVPASWDQLKEILPSVSSMQIPEGHSRFVVDGGAVAPM